MKSCWRCKKVRKFHAHYGWCEESDIPIIAKKKSENIDRAKRCPIYKEVE